MHKRLEFKFIATMEEAEGETVVLDTLLTTHAFSLSCDHNPQKERKVILECVYTEAQIRSCHPVRLETSENECSASYNICMAAVTISTNDVLSSTVFLGEKTVFFLCLEEAPPTEMNKWKIATIICKRVLEKLILCLQSVDTEYYCQSLRVNKVF